MNKKVLISLHDIAPIHLSRLEKAEELLTRWGVKKISFLFIPDYHKENDRMDGTLMREFKQWINSAKDIEIQWLLHGFYHLEIYPQAQDNGKLSPSFSSLKDILKGKVMTAREGEFNKLSIAGIIDRIEAGMAAFTDFFHQTPDIFIPPAWLFNRHLLPILKKKQFKITEDHSFIYFLDKSEKKTVPVITWATRTPLRKFISILGCPLLRRLWKRKDLIRLAVHPFDFDHPATINSIEKVVKAILAERECILYKNL